VVGLPAAERQTRRQFGGSAIQLVFLMPTA
jgi:hypothetical protein